MNVLETDWWTLAVPPEWWADSEEDSVLVGDRDDVGCIEISTLQKEAGSFDRDSVTAVAKESAAEPSALQEATLGDFKGWVSAEVEEGVALREWYVAHGSLLLFITYSCELENRGMDDAAVDQILDTLALREAP